MKKLKYLVVAICLICFAIICINVVKYDVLEFDKTIYNFIASHIINDNLTPFVKVITHLGGVAFTVICGVLIFIFSKKYRFFIGFDLVGVTVVNQLVKHLVCRNRPDVLRLVEETGFSFPSGHSMVSIAFYGIIIYLIYKNIDHKALKYSLIAFLSLLVLGIGFSRIYVGVHYATDVLGGFFLGLAYLIIYISIYNKRSKRNEK